MNRRRNWLVLLAVVVATALYLGSWSYYAWTHTEAERYVELPAGSVAELPGASIRLLGVSRAAELKDESDSSSDPAPVGSMWVIASMEVVLASREDNLFCSPEIVGHEGRSWPYTGSAYSPIPGTEVCRDEETPLNRPVRFDATFQVPDGYLDDLVGVALRDELSADPDQLLLPPS